MLQINGAVEAEWPDEGVAAHYGDPMREQRAMTEGRVLVDRSNRGVVKVTGQDRLGWLHSLTSQHVERLAPGVTTETLILSPQGHLEHHLTLIDDGTATWIHVEPGTAKAVVDFLNSMRFMMRVEVEDRLGCWWCRRWRARSRLRAESSKRVLALPGQSPFSRRGR